MGNTSFMEPNTQMRLDNQILYDAFRASPIGMAVENLEGQPLFVNPALCSMLRFSEEELRKKHCVQFSPPEDAEKDWALFQQLRSGEIDHYQIDKRYFRRDGSLVWGRLSISLLNSRPSPLVVALVEDITERRTAEDALRESEERLRLAAQVGKMYAFSWNVATDEVVRSAEYSAILGVGSDQALTRSQFVEKIHSEDRAGFVTAVADLTSSNPNIRLVYRVLRSDGSVIWLEENARAVFDSEGKMLRLIGMVADVTERELTKQEFALTNERSKLAMEAAGIGGWDFDLLSRRQRWFGKAHAQLGMTPDDGASSQAFWDHVHPDDRDALRSALQAAKQDHTDFGHEFRVVWADGTVRWLHSMGRYYYGTNGKPERMLGMSVDVTERKRAEQVVRESEERLRLAQSAARIGTFEWNIQSGLNTWTPELESVYGLPKGGFGGTQAAFESLVHPADLPGVMMSVKESFKTGQPTSGEWRAVWPDGSSHWIAGHWQVFMDESGQPSRVVGVNANVTERKRTEEELSAMTRKLVEAQEQERARIGRELHDDISQRLAMLAIELEQLERDPSDVESRLQELRKRTNEISGDVQALSHELHSSRLEYLGAVAGIRGWCKEFGERQGMEINFTSDVSNPLPFEIGLCLFRVVQEALHNVLKHSGVKLIEVQLTQQSSEVDLTVSDSGRGFNVEPGMQGQGLGLTSMRERVRLVNGTINIASKPTGGTTIRVRVPLTTQAAQRAAG